MRIALLTLESALSAAAVLRLAEQQAERIVLIGRSLPYRAAAGGMPGQMRAHWRRSGPRLLPYLLVNYGLPQALGGLRRALGRGALSGFARRRGIPLLAVEDVNGPAMAAALRAARPDLILSFHFDQILRAEILALAPLGGINVHPSLLPRHRGPVPTLWAMRETPPAFGVTVHRMVPRIDAGAILAQQAMALPPGVTASTAARLLHEAGAALLGPLLAALEAAAAPPAGRPQDLSQPGAPYCPFPSAGALREMAWQGQRTVGWEDLHAALAAPVG
ncbi:formyltransferase family protein [Teichococcus aestuarii]|uniref:Formyl transferase n=1 Tax=Teichococcus aestuarii TaxID=568898 RepID=A0A2U1V8F3_9PROT|nr:formyltransferase family protein [Pseudoroseomonas aestuarii]PWC30198.1 formyl transferase [Pseudoroseomonas aestuarii]